MLNNVFTAIQSRLMNGAPLGLAHFGWYRRQERDSNQAQPYHAPAVLLEVAPITWQTLSSRVQMATAQLIIHVVQDRYKEGQDHLTLAQQVKNRLVGFSAAGTIGPHTHTFLNSMQCVGERTDHNQTNRDVHVLTFQAVIFDYGAVLVYQKESPTPEVQGDFE